VFARQHAAVTAGVSPEGEHSSLLHNISWGEPMFILNFLRYINGNVRFSVAGEFAERFVNLAARERIPLWDCKRRSGTLNATTSAKSYRELRGIAKKTGVRLRIEEKYGAPFTRRKYRRRWGLLSGFGIFLTFLITMSLFIWNVDVTGLETIPESRVLQTLEELGVHPGSLRMSIDVRSAERRALLLMPELSWISINIEGSNVSVEISERRMPPIIVDAGAPCNLVASVEGQIVSINVFEGQALVQPGDAVAQGDILISGVTQDGAGNNLFRHARGEVRARIERQIILEIPLEQIRYVSTGEIKNRGYIELFGMTLPLFLPTRLEGFYQIERSERDISPLGIPLPIRVHSRRYHMQREETVTITEQAAREQAARELVAIEALDFAGGEILERSLRAFMDDGILTLEAGYIAIIDITQQREIIIEHE